MISELGRLGGFRVEVLVVKAGTLLVGFSGIPGGFGLVPVGLGLSGSGAGFRVVF